MVAGLIDHETGARDIRQLGGFGRAMPITFAAGLLAALSMGGLPLFSGFLAKEEIYGALVGGGAWPMLLVLVAVAGNALMFAIAFMVGLKPFIGPVGDTPNTPHEGPLLLWAGPLVLAVLGLGAGLFSQAVHAIVSSPMASAVAGAPVEITASAVPHAGLPLYLSLATIALGVAAYLAQNRLRTGMASLLVAVGWGPDRGFDQSMRGLIRLSFAVTRIVQNGRLDIYLTITFIAVAAALLVPMIAYGELPAWPKFPDLLLHEWTIILIAVIGLGAILYASDRLTAIVSLGIQGFAVALLFLLFGAPDLSFTQFMVETLSVVILALVMTRLRLSPVDHRPAREKALDLTVSGACGLAFALLLLKVTQLPFDDTLSKFYEAHSLALAHGRNIVNVIIVDFRGLDTLGEIAVVMVAGLAILALIRVRAAPDAASPGRRRRADMRTLIFRTVAPYLTALMLLFSVFVLLRGHNEPGGGFIGGLIAASAFAIHGIAFGVADGTPCAAFPSDSHFRVRAAAGRVVRVALARLGCAVPDRPMDFAHLAWCHRRRCRP